MTTDLSEGRLQYTGSIVALNCRLRNLLHLDCSGLGFFFNFFFKFYWNIVNFQGSDNLCCTTKWPSHPCIRIHSLRFFSHIDDPRTLGRVPCAIQQVRVGQSFCIPQCACAKCQSQTPSPSLPLPDLSLLVTVSFSKNAICSNMDRPGNYTKWS